MKIKVNYIEHIEKYDMCEVMDPFTGKERIVNVGGRYLPF